MKSKLLALITLLMLIGGFGGFSYSISKKNSTLKNSLLNLEQKTELLSQNLENTKQTLAFLIEGDETLQARLEEEQNKRILAEAMAEENSKTFEEKIGSLNQELTAQKEAAKAADITTIISHWSPKIARLTCEFQAGEKTITTKGSSVAGAIQTAPILITNKHVILRSDATLKSCGVFFPESNSDIDISKGNIIPAEDDIDTATIKGFDSSELPIGTFSPLSYCQSKPILGDQVIILGYPAVGSTKTITATNGIISGFDDEYYITSAKIEQGNSGGAAILVKNNCLLGIPTLVVKGKLESLARIFPLKN